MVVDDFHVASVASPPHEADAILIIDPDAVLALALRTMLPWITAAVVRTAMIAGMAVWYLKKPEPRQVTRLYYELPKEQQFANLSLPELAVSPDGLCIQSVLDHCA